MAQRASDQLTLTDLTDGISVILSSESYAFPGTTSTAIAGSTTTKIAALMGADLVAASVNVAQITKPANVTVTSDSHATSPTLTITVTAAVTTGGNIEIPVVVNGVTIVKTFSFSISFKGTTGSPGVSSTLVGLKNEAHNLVAHANGNINGASTIQVDFYGYVGATRTAVTAAVGTLPSGMTVGTNTPGTASADGILTLSVSNNATLGGANSGVVPITLSCNGVSRAVNFAWSKSRAGADGDDGAAAVTLELESSQGLIFKNTQVETVLTARVYQGGVEVNGAALAALGTVKWYKNGTYITGKDGVSLTVAPGDVNEKATYAAKLEY